MSPEPLGEAITAKGLRELKAELAELEGPRRQEIAARIAVAREMGDLKENAEYHIAKEDQGHLETKILLRQSRLRAAVVVENDGESDTVAFGATVTVTDVTSGRTSAWQIVGPTEADAKTGKLSSESPVAVALIGARAGDTVKVTTPGGVREMTVDKLG